MFIYVHMHVTADGAAQGCHTRHCGGMYIADACMWPQTEPHRDVTHVIVEAGNADAKGLPEALPGAKLLTPDWLVATLERGKRQPEEQYAVQPGSGAHCSTMLNDENMCACNDAPASTHPGGAPSAERQRRCVAQQISHRASPIAHSRGR